jgi:hypothetical protein
MLFPTLKDAGTGMMQIAEIQFYGTPGYEASGPNPANGATDVPVGTDLCWTPGAGAV